MKIIFQVVVLGGMVALLGCTTNDGPNEQTGMLIGGVVGGLIGKMVN